MASTAVMAASGAAPAVAMSTPSGKRARLDSGTTMRSAQAPSCTSGAIAGSSRTPGRPPTAPTPLPTSSTTPAKSRPSMTGYECGTMSRSIPAAIALSTGLADDACTRTST